MITAADLPGPRAAAHSSVLPKYEILCPGAGSIINLHTFSEHFQHTARKINVSWFKVSWIWRFLNDAQLAWLDVMFAINSCPIVCIVMVTAGLSYSWDLSVFASDIAGGGAQYSTVQCSAVQQPGAGQHNRLVNCPCCLAQWPGLHWTLFGKPIKAEPGPGPGQSRASPVLETVAYWDIMMSSAAVL